MSKDRYTRPRPIIISMIAALVLAIAPMPAWAESFRPDFVTLTLIYWAMNLPTHLQYRLGLGYRSRAGRSTGHAAGSACARAVAGDIRHRQVSSANAPVSDATAPGIRIGVTCPLSIHSVLDQRRCRRQLAGSQLLGTSFEWGADLAIDNDVIWRGSLPRA